MNSRIGLPLVAAFVFALGWMVLRHFTGVVSVNGPKVIYAFAAMGVTAGLGGLLLGERERTRVLWGLMCATVILAIYTLLQWRGIIFLPWDIYLDVSGRMSGSLGNPNLLGSYMASVLPAGVAFLLTRPFRPALRIWAASVFALLCIMCIITSGTRGSLLGLLFGVGLLGIVLSIRGTGSPVRRFLPLGAAIAGILLIVIFMWSRFREFSNLEHGTARVRLVIWTGGIEMFADKPITGWGPGTFQIVFPRYRNPEYSMMGTSHNTEHAHSEYIELLTDLGLVGVFLLAFLGWQIWKGVRKEKPDLLALGLMTGCASLLVEASVSVSLRWPPSAFLLTIYICLLLAGSREKERSVPRFWALPLLAFAGFTGLVEAPDYVRSMNSGHLLFVGKDIFLDEIDRNMGLAGNAAVAWEQTGDESRRLEALARYDSAAVLCDRSIAWLSNCVRLNPSELGGWYGLGSAYLTKDLILQPANQSLLRLLQASRGYEPSRDAILLATNRALAAYDSLIARAPDYAEVHNNLALTYTRLGMPAETMHSLRRAYQLHAHRRDDYLLQAEGIGPLGGWFDAAHFLWESLLEGQEDEVRDGMDQKTALRRQIIQWFSGFALSSNPELADSLSAALSEVATESGYPSAEWIPGMIGTQAGYVASGRQMLDAWAAGDTAGLAARADSELAAAAGVVLPSQFLVRHLIGAERGEPGSVDSLLVFGRHLRFDGFLWLSVSQGGNAYLRGALDACLADCADSASVPASRTILLESLRSALQMDIMLSKLVIISQTDFADGVDPVTAGELDSRWTEIGGPQAAATNGKPVPWLGGSLVGGFVADLDSLVARRPADSELLCTRIAVEYEILSSFWWGSPRFTEAYRDFLLIRIADDREALRSLLGDEEAVYRTAALMEQAAGVTEGLIPPDFAPFIERLRLDITNNHVLAPIWGVGTP
jgi:oligosaccharide repeat unit polymerase